MHAGEGEPEVSHGGFIYSRGLGGDGRMHTDKAGDDCMHACFLYYRLALQGEETPPDSQPPDSQPPGSQPPGSHLEAAPISEEAASRSLVIAISRDLPPYLCACT